MVEQAIRQWREKLLIQATEEMKGSVDSSDLAVTSCNTCKKGSSFKVLYLQIDLYQEGYAHSTSRLPKYGN